MQSFLNGPTCCSQHFFIFFHIPTWQFAMEFAHFENINPAEILPRIPDINVLPFGVIKMDLTSKVFGIQHGRGRVDRHRSSLGTGQKLF